MSYIKQTISSFDDFFDKFSAFAVSSGWTLEEDKLVSDNRQIYFTNPDSSVSVGLLTEYDYEGSGNFFKNIRTSYIRTNVSSSYDSGLTFQNQPDGYNSISKSISFCDDTEAIMFMHVTDNRILVCISQGNRLIVHLSFGKYLAYGSPLQQPNPFYIDSQSTQSANSSVSSKSYESPVAYFEGSWINPTVFPSRTDYEDIITNEDFTTFTLYPIIYREDDSYSNNTGYALGEMDGIYLIPRYKNEMGYEFSIGTDNYIVLNFGNINEVLYCIKTN